MATDIFPTGRTMSAHWVKRTCDGAVRTSDSGRVEVWRGGFRSNISVTAPFVWRCLSDSTMAPFPHPAHRTGHAGFPRIRLSDKTSRLHPRHVAPKRAQAYEPEVPVKVRELARSPIRDPLTRGFSHFVASMTAPVASGWSGCRVGLAPTGKRRLSTAHTRSGLWICGVPGVPGSWALRSLRLT